MNFKDERFEYAIGYALEGCRDILVQEMVESNIAEPGTEWEAQCYIDWLIYESEFEYPKKRATIFQRAEKKSLYSRKIRKRRFPGND